MLKEAFIFDGDGTTFDTWPIAYEIWKKVSAELGLSAEKDCDRDAALKKYWGYPGPKMIEFLFPAIDKNIAFKKWVEIQRELMTKRKINLIAGTDETLMNLRKKGIMLGFLTNRDSLYFLKDFKDFPLKKYFDFVQTWQRFSALQKMILLLRGKKIEKIHSVHFETPFFKPDPRVFKKILKYLESRGISKENITYFGDTCIDYEAATGANIKFIGVKTGPLDCENLWPPKAKVLNSIADLNFCDLKNLAGGKK